MATEASSAPTTNTVTVSQANSGQLMQVLAQPPPPFLMLPGDPTIPYDTWIKMYTNFELLGGFDKLDPAIRRAHFIASLGSEGQRIFFSLEVRDDSLDAAKDAVRAHFVAVTCEETLRYQFKTRGQSQDENIDTYVAELRRLIVGCNYDRYGADCEKEMIRDQIVEKVYDSKVREKLLLRANELCRQKKRMTLQDAIEICRAAESVKAQSSIMNGAEGVNKVQSHSHPVRKPNQSTSKKKVTCYACSKDGHMAGDSKCKAKGKRCNECSGIGHFSGSKFCKGKADLSCKSVNQSDTPTETVNILAISSQSGNKIMTNCNVTSKSEPTKSFQTQFQVDCGSNVSILPHDMYMSNHFSDELVPAPRKLTDYSGQMIPVVGCTTLSIELDGDLTSAFFYLAKRGSAILGMDVLKPTGFELSESVSQVSGKPSPKPNRKVVTKFAHHIKLKSDAKPVKQKYRAPPYAVRDKVRSELDRLQSEGIIEPVDSSEWVSPLVVVGKKASDEIRICTDLSALNQNILVDCFPLPIIEELVHSMKDAKVFSTLDLKSAYNQVPLTDDCKDLTAFITADGLFRWRRIPFGLASAPSFFSKMMNSVLHECRSFCVWYLDDICVFGPDAKTHDKFLKLVIEKLDQVGLVLNYSKCKLRQSSVDFLGCCVSSEGITPLDDKVSAIASMECYTVGDLQKFLGMTQYYARFVPNLSSMTKELRGMITKPESDTLSWTDKTRSDYNLVKQAMICSDVLVGFDSKLQTIVTTDASGVGLGAYLSQIQNDGSERIVAFASKSLSDTESAYSTLELEALSCVWAIERWHTYLWGRKFLLRTDHNPLTSLLGATLTKRAGHRVARWRSRLKVYNFDVKHVKGVDNVIADTMSRLPVGDKTPVSDDDTEVVAIVSGAIDFSEFTEKCKSDALIQELIRVIKAHWRTKSDILDHTYYKLKDEFSIQGDLVLRDDRVVVPEAMQSKVISLGHEAHQGITKCKRYIRSFYWFKGMDSMIEEAVRNCETCKLNDKSCITRDAPLNPVKLPDQVWQKVGIDCVGPFNIANRDKRYAVTLVDYRSKWPEVAFMSSITSKNIIQFLERIFAREGFPEEIVSDNAANFVSSEFEEYLSSCGIKHLKSSTYYPRANGEVERFNRTFKQTIQDAVNAQVDWNKAVLSFLQIYRASPNSTTGVSPSVLLHGRRMRTRLMLDRAVAPAEDLSGVDDKVELYQAKQKQYTDSRRAAIDLGFESGDLVRVKQFTPAAKGRSRFSEPVAIQSQIAPNTYRLSSGESANQSRLARVSAPPTRQSSRVSKGTLPMRYNDFVMPKP